MQSDGSDSAEEAPPEAAAAAEAPARVVKPLSKKKLEKHLAEQKKRGVLFLPRVPPYLKPGKLRDLLSGYGAEVLRVYLKAEEAEARARRRRAGGNKKKSYTEGWVEFSDKKIAKRIATTLNTTPMGDGRRSFYQHDLWCIKYLKNFKWNDLTEKIAYENRVRQEKMRAEMAQAKKETSFYLQQVDKAKAIAAMEAKKAKRAAEAGAGGASGGAAAGGGKRKQQPGGDAGASAPGGQAARQRFKQRRLAAQDAAAAGGANKGLLQSLMPS